MIKKKAKKGEKRGKSGIRKMIDWLHLWLGLVSGIIVLVIAVSGCLFTFQKEINEWYYHDKMFVTPAGTAPLPVTQLTRNAQEALGDRLISNMTAYKAPDRAWEFMTYKGNDTALTYFGAVEYYEVALVNPYTGKVTAVLDYKHNFFFIVKYLHWSLLLNTPYGQPIVGWATFIFVVLLITGLVLWWPKKWTKATREQSFKVRWKAGFKRVNYDLHNVLGFYAMSVALVLALTGMVWSFTWFRTAVYVAAAGTITAPAKREVKSVLQTVNNTNQSMLDSCFAAAQRILPDARRYYIRAAAMPEAVHTIGGYKSREQYFSADELKFDQYNGQLLARSNDTHKNRGERLIDMNYDIHVGAIGGIWGKIVVFIVGLICASLPVTGFYVWWNKKKKSKKKIVLDNKSTFVTSL
ncbi:MAG: PepSY domain-containing protein [Chitinophaga sp.]|uniref:PepSY-associated TM helix domain-containing protein n=1 Tax=Chitinophaga sp. TaxID=1869181 RepID=UPI0025C036FF|nr:PepSY-associated TM helix domain-containing protein [Chitinophaga sp.]MBV8252763.1 PepSY domain-containing protein [Chitinophaga sp.]